MDTLTADVLTVIFVTGLVLAGAGAGAGIIPMMWVGIALLLIVCAYSVYDYTSRRFDDGS